MPEIIIIFTLFTYQHPNPYAVMQLLAMIHESTGPKVAIELISLCINLSLNADVANIMCANNGLKFLVKRAIKTNDSLLFKMIRNISTHGPEHKVWC